MKSLPPVKLRTVLLIDDEVEFRRQVRRSLEQVGFEVREAGTIAEAEEQLWADSRGIDLVLSDIHLPDRNGILFLASLSARGLRKHPWLFISGDPSPELLQSVLNAGGVDLVRRPCARAELLAVVRRALDGESDATRQAMQMVEQLTGIQLPEEKRLLFQTRLNHRVRALGLLGAKEYLEYFRDHRALELPELIAVVSTHTTHFFRESEHFDFLQQSLFEEAFARSGKIQIWSAASSTGQEVYTLAIAALEFLRRKGKARAPEELVTILGTDIDFRSLDFARNGVYSRQEVANIPPVWLQQYFDEGQGELAGFYRVKDVLHRMVRFEQMNLLSMRPVGFTPDVVFLRNVLMYFSTETAVAIIQKLAGMLPAEASLFLGMSEASLGLKAGLEPVGKAVYSVRATSRRRSA